jgi:hypothetical protein
MGGLIVMTEISLTEFIGFRESKDGGQQKLLVFPAT